MTNVLPPEKLQQLRSGVRAKFVMTAALVLAVAAIAGLIALAPAFFVVYFSKIKSPAELSTQGDAEMQRRADQEIAARTRALLKEVATLTKKPISPSEAITAAYSLSPKGVTVGGAAYTKGEPGTITLVGVAKSRDEVSAFRDALEGDDRFVTVSVPVAALVGVLEGNFTITLTGKF